MCWLTQIFCSEIGYSMFFFGYFRWQWLKLSGFCFHGNSVKTGVFLLLFFCHKSHFGQFYLLSIPGSAAPLSRIVCFWWNVLDAMTKETEGEKLVLVLVDVASVYSVDLFPEGGSSLLVLSDCQTSSAWNYLPHLSAEATWCWNHCGAEHISYWFGKKHQAVWSICSVRARRPIHFTLFLRTITTSAHFTAYWSQWAVNTDHNLPRSWNFMGNKLSTIYLTHFQACGTISR